MSVLRASFRIAVALGCLSICAPTQAADFKGILVGAEHTTAQITKALGAPCSEIGTECAAPTTIAGAPAFARVVRKKKIVRSIRVFFQPKFFAQVESACLAKYGKPETRFEDLQNGFGAKFRNVQHEWHDAQGNVVRLTQYPKGFSDDSSLVLLSHEVVSQEVEKTKRDLQDL